MEAREFSESMVTVAAEATTRLLEAAGVTIAGFGGPAVEVALDEYVSHVAALRVRAHTDEPLSISSASLVGELVSQAGGDASVLQRADCIALTSSATIAINCAAGPTGTTEPMRLLMGAICADLAQSSADTAMPNLITQEQASARIHRVALVQQARTTTGPRRDPPASHET